MRHDNISLPMTSKRADIAGLPQAVISAREAAGIIGHSISWLYKHKAKLEAQGFPKRDDLLGGWPRVAVEGWVARRMGISPSSPSAGKDRLRRAIDARKNALRHEAH